MTRSFHPIRLFVEFIPIFYAQFQHDVSPATALHSDIKASSPFESHLIGIDAGIG
jgi:hypothetical protein